MSGAITNWHEVRESVGAIQEDLDIVLNSADGEYPGDNETAFHSTCRVEMRLAALKQFFWAEWEKESGR